MLVFAIFLCAGILHNWVCASMNADTCSGTFEIFIHAMNRILEEGAISVWLYFNARNN